MSSERSGAEPLCSVIVTNHNYARYLPACVESVLAQTYRRLDVVVVDDGSTDDSAAILAAYAAEIRIVTKRNGGQASAMNQGFAASRGEIVLFLDGDDMLLPDTVERVVAAWRRDTVKLHFRLQKIQADGTPLPGALLPPYRPLPSGDLRRLVRRFGFYPSPPTSGNAFARWYLDRLMPLPEHLYRVAADTMLIGPAPLYGRIDAIAGVGGCWRRHSGNVSHVGMETLRKRLEGDLAMVAFVQDRAPAGSEPGTCPRARWPQHLKERMLVRKFMPGADDPEGMSLRHLAFAYLRTILTWPEYGPGRRAMLAAWAAAMMLLPRSMLCQVSGLGGGSIRLK